MNSVTAIITQENPLPSCIRAFRWDLHIRGFMHMILLMTNKDNVPINWQISGKASTTIFKYGFWISKEGDVWSSSILNNPIVFKKLTPDICCAKIA